jgi:hypothetical protein
MSNTNTGGPAFPGPYVNDKGGLEAIWKQGGMTLRDYFAAKALPAIYKDTCECARVEGWPLDWRGEVAGEAYDLADAMLKAREQ